MIQRVLLLVVCLFGLQFTFSAPLAVSVPTAPLPDWIIPVRLPEASQIKGDEVSDGYLYRLRDVQYYLPAQTRFYHFVREIYSSAGVQQASEVEVSYDPAYEKLIFHEVTIIRNGNTINKLQAGKFKVMQRETGKESFIYDGSWSALLILEDVRIGDQIAYSFSLVGSNPIYEGKFAASFNLGYYDPTDVLSVRIVAPKQVELTIKNQQTTHQLQIIREKDWVDYRWQLENVPGTAVENDVPVWYNPYPHVQVSQYVSWQEVSEWAMRLYRTPTAMSAGLQKFIADLQKDHEPDLRQVERVLQFVQDDVRYTGLESGIGAYKPRNPSVVFDQRFGDCKDKSLLLCFILRELGIEAYPALVNTETRHKVADGLPSPQAFNHCITLVNINGGQFWYDPTASHQGGSYQNRHFPDYGYALVVRNGSRQLTKIEARGSGQTHVKETFAIGAIGGPASLSIVTEYYGSEADRQRYYFANSTLKEIEKNYLNYNAKNYPQIKVTQALRFSDDRQANKVVTYESYQIIDFWAAPDSAKPDALECTAYPQVIRDKLFLPDTKIRHSPVALEYPLNFFHTLHFQVPEDWPAEAETKEINGPGIRFVRKISCTGAQLTVSYRYTTEADHVSASESAGFIRKQNEIISSLGYTLTYNRNPQEAAAATSANRVNWLMVLLAVMFAIGVVFASLKVYAYDPLPEETYQEEGREFGGWLVLFLLALAISPLLRLIHIFNPNYFNWQYWENISNPSLSTYHPVAAGLLVAELFFNILMEGFSVLLLVLFFRKRSSVPHLVTVYCGIAVSFVIMEALLVKPVDNSYRELIQTLIGAAIWIPYFRLSSRVKATFIHTLRVPENVQQIYRSNF